MLEKVEGKKREEEDDQQMDKVDGLSNNGDECPVGRFGLNSS